MPEDLEKEMAAQIAAAKAFSFDRKKFESYVIDGDQLNAVIWPAPDFVDRHLS
jgi:hypothetical protein